MKDNFDTLAIIRKNLLNTVAELSTEQLNRIPDGFNNSIIWNLAHVVVTQQLLMYGMSGLELPISTSIVGKFRKGTKPDNPATEEEIREIRSLFAVTLARAKTDYDSGLFSEYKSYQTSFGKTLNSIEEAIRFNNVHESMHLGHVKAMTKLV